MARVTVTEILKRDDGEIAALNTTQTAWNTQSGDIGAVNIAQEGIDRRNIAVDAVNDGMDTVPRVYADDAAGTVVSAFPVPVQIGGVNIEIGFFFIGDDADYETIVRCVFEHKCADDHEFSLWYSDDGAVGIGVFAQLDQTQRTYAGIDDKWFSGGMSTRDTTGSTTDKRWYALYAWSIGAVQIDIQDVTFYVERILR
ncbi:MAG TPA: hypothetical protein VI911_04360 [Patescibacteria group bacterium]|nr:hypothetical protein [Patescibacteria group bacterium]